MQLIFSMQSCLQMEKNQVTLKSLQKYEVKAFMTKVKLILILLLMIQKYPLQKLK